MGKVTDYIISLVKKRVKDDEIVVWYDPDSDYGPVVDELEKSGLAVLRFDGSFIRLKRELEPYLEFVGADGTPKHDCGAPPDLLVYLPLERRETDYALIEADCAGVILEPGSTDPACNTRLRGIAEQVFKTISPDQLDQITRKVDAGVYTLADLDKIKTPDNFQALTLIYDTTNTDEIMPALDKKASSVFAGKVVRKDLIRKVKAGANIPVFVLEYLLGKYCATDDTAAIEAGLRVVNTTIAENCVRPDEANRVQSKVKESGKYTLIDKISVRYLSENDKYWAHLLNFGHKYVHIPERFIRGYDRLLMGGIWAEIKLIHQFDEEQKGKRSPFWIQELNPIQLASFDLDEYLAGRRAFSTDEWIDILLRSVGLEPAYFERRVKLLLLCRLLPLCEQNFNLIELGPRGTGKSYYFQEISPYVILLTGPTTVANFFFNLATSKMGLVGLWDAIGFDEVGDLQQMKKEVVTTLKTYCESGMFARGKDALSGKASIALFGNTNQPVEVMVRSSHLFIPLPDIIREDMAFLDRLHFYLPGWDIPKMRIEFFTDHYGFVVDYLAEALKELRKHNYTEMIDHYFSLGAHLNARDVKAIRKTVSGLIKLLYPHGEVSKEEMAELVETALEGRRRVKEQLKKMGSFEKQQLSWLAPQRSEAEKRRREKKIQNRRSPPRPPRFIGACRVGIMTGN